MPPRSSFLAMTTAAIAVAYPRSYNCRGAPAIVATLGRQAEVAEEWSVALKNEIAEQKKALSAIRGMEARRSQLLTEAKACDLEAEVLNSRRLRFLDVLTPTLKNKLLFQAYYHMKRANQCRAEAEILWCRTYALLLKLS